MTETTPLIGKSQNLNRDFILSGRDLTLVLKDGYGVFSNHGAALRERFGDPTKTTTIIIVHPDSPHMPAVTAMDSKKTVETQRSDCLQAVKISQSIRDFLRTDSFPVTDRVKFIGIDNVPTWNGWVSDDAGVKQLYPTRGYRGTLLALNGSRHKDASAEARMVMAEILADVRAMKKGQNEPHRNLWNYKLPAHLPDLRH